MAITATLELIMIAVFSIATSLGFSLPRGAYSRHALEKRAAEAVNATTIADDMVKEMEGDSPCDKSQYHFCWRQRPHVKWLCWQGKLVNGLLIGFDGKVQIITGYPASAKYWLGTCRRDLCFILDSRIVRTSLQMRFPGMFR